MTARDLCSRAVADLGRTEGDPAIPWATPSKPWCAIQASHWLQACGVAIPDTWAAIDVLAWLGARGLSIPHDGPLLAGDVVCWPRRDATGVIVGHHVSIVLADTAGGLVVVAGNSSSHADRVAISVVPRSKVTNAARVLRG